MKVKTVTRFRDLETDKIRKPGETFEVAKERADKLIELGFVESVPEKKQEEKIEKG